jgi:hypothetical protein
MPPCFENVMEAIVKNDLLVEAHAR